MISQRRFNTDITILRCLKLLNNILKQRKIGSESHFPNWLFKVCRCFYVQGDCSSNERPLWADILHVRWRHQI